MQSKPVHPALHPAIVTWALLMLATVISWYLGGNHALPGGTKEMAVSLIAIVAFVKVHLVGNYFMELRHAPRTLRLVFSGWMVLTCALIVGLYLAV